MLASLPAGRSRDRLIRSVSGPSCDRLSGVLQIGGGGTESLEAKSTKREQKTRVVHDNLDSSVSYGTVLMEYGTWLGRPCLQSFYLFCPIIFSIIRCANAYDCRYTKNGNVHLSRSFICRNSRVLAQQQVKFG